MGWWWGEESDIPGLPSGSRTQAWAIFDDDSDDSNEDNDDVDDDVHVCSLQRRHDCVKI